MNTGIRFGKGADPAVSPRLSVPQSVRQLGGNSWEVLKRNSISAQLQNPAKLKNNSLIISTFILVLSRIVVAHFSAVKARGTEEESHRTREAIRTFMRELVGWMLSYVVLRRIQAVAKGAMKRFFQINDGAEDTAMKMMWDTVKNSVRGKKYSLPAPQDAAAPSVFKVGALGEKREKAMAGLLKKLSFGKLDLDPRALLKTTYKWGPIVIGSIPAVLLAGYALERFTRDYADRVVDRVSQFFGVKKASTQANPSETTETTPASQPVSQNRQRFDRFLQNVQQKQAERGAAQHEGVPAGFVA